MLKNLGWRQKCWMWTEWQSSGLDIIDKIPNHEQRRGPRNGAHGRRRFGYPFGKRIGIPLGRFLFGLLGSGTPHRGMPELCVVRGDRIQARWHRSDMLSGPKNFKLRFEYRHYYDVIEYWSFSKQNTLWGYEEGEHESWGNELHQVVSRIRFCAEFQCKEGTLKWAMNVEICTDASHSRLKCKCSGNCTVEVVSMVNLSGESESEDRNKIRWPIGEIYEIEWVNRGN